jgi:hypothetical protein
MSNKAHRPVHTPPPIAGVSLVIRALEERDSEQIARIAQLDSATIPAGDLLVAELGGEIVAALPLGGGRAIADPFRRSADAVELLHQRARQVGGSAPKTPRVIARTPLSRPARHAA